MKKRDFSILKETISQENVLVMSELIAIMEIRFQIGYVRSRAQKMYNAPKIYDYIRLKI